MTGTSRIGTQHGATCSLMVAVLLALTYERAWGAYNCSRSLSPWVYAYQSTLKFGGRIMYDGEPITNITSWFLRRYPMKYRPGYRSNIVEFSATGGAHFVRNIVDLENIIPMPLQLKSATFDYDVTCTGGMQSSIAIVIEDVNDESPRFIGLSSSIELSEDTCTGEEIYNFASEVEDRDYADRPNGEKLLLIIIQSRPLSDAFIVSGRLGIRLNKRLKRSLSPYVLILTLQDKALNNATSTLEFTVNIIAGVTHNSSYSNFENCTTLNTSLSGLSRTEVCLTDIEVAFFESEVQIGKPVKFRGVPIQNLLTLTRSSCDHLKNSSLELLELTDDGLVVFGIDFNLDDVINEGRSEGIRCLYNFNCKSNDEENPISGYLRIYLMDENDEAPIFTAGAAKNVNIHQNTEHVYSFRGHVRDRDCADWPNDDRLELIIIRDLWNSCGETVSGVISVTERLALRIEPKLNVSRCSPYHLTVALKDHTSRIGPHHNLTIHVSADREVYCEKLTMNLSDTLVFTLPRTRAPSVFVPRCASTGEEILRAQCEQVKEDANLAQYNVFVRTYRCPDEVMPLKLSDLYQASLSETDMLNFAEQLRNLTSSSSELQTEDLNYASRILENMVAFYENMTVATDLLNQVSSFVAETVSNLMEANSDVLDEARGRDIMLTSRIVGSIDAMLLKLAVAMTEEDHNTTVDPQSIIFQSKNLAYQVTTNTTIVGMGTCSSENGTAKTFHVLYNSSTSDCLFSNGFPLAELIFSRASQGAARVIVAYANAALFESGAASGAAVLSAQLIETLAEENNESEVPVVTVRQRINQTSVDNGIKLYCGYWNFSINRWDASGCSLGPKEDGRGMVVCTCNHLTNIAVLMMPYTDKLGRREHDEMFDNLSMIFLAVSSFALLLVLLTFFAYREIHQSDGPRLTACTSTSLLCVNILFICGIKAANDYADVCSALAVVLHYFLLTTFLFITTEVITLYLLLIKAFDAHAKQYMWKVLVVCLGAPMAIVISIRFGNHSVYEHVNRYCWMQPILLFYGVLLPVGLAIVVNLIVLALIARALSRLPKLQTSVRETMHAKRQAIALASVVIVLGVTWSFSILTALEASSATWEYLFVLGNALQGLFVLIFYIAKAHVFDHCRNKATEHKRRISYFNDIERNKSLSSTPAVDDISGNKESIGAEIGSSLPANTTMCEASSLRS